MNDPDELNLAALTNVSGRRKHIILFHEGDRMRCIADEAVDSHAFGVPVRRRASHIWPAQPVKRLAFRCLRRIFADRGPVAAWTRTWQGAWQVRWADDAKHVAFAHPSRRTCLEWERSKLNQRLNR